MQVDYIVLGQGISGTFLSYFLMQQGASVLVIDAMKANSASRVASAVINPVTGRRVVKTWMIDDILPFAEKVYHEIGEYAGMKDVIQSCPVLDFVPTQQMLDAFTKRVDENADYISFSADENGMREYFNFPLKIGEIRSSYNIALWELLAAYRQRLQENSMLLEEHFNWDNCILADSKVFYKDIVAKKILCCEGVEGGTNPYFQQLPYAFNKGEALIVSIPGLPQNNIYKMAMTIVPLQEKDLFWVGSNYQWTYEDELPSRFFRTNTENYLNHWLKLPFEVKDHIASVRPANVERRPFAGLHPVYPSIGILNGMGSKGCSLAPYFAYQLAHHVLYAKEIELLADVRRFEKVLSK